MSLISYASSEFKALSVPLDQCGAGVMANDFSRFHGGVPEGKTEMRLSRSREELFLQVRCFEPTGIIVQNADQSVFSNDRLEIFFGAMEPEPWLIQFIVGAGGCQWDNMGFSGRWKSVVKVEKGFWTADMVFPLSLFRMNNLSVGFNICRYATERDEFSTWCTLKNKFHEPENYGLLLMDDYSRVLFSETGVYPEKELTRTEFESSISSLRIPANTLQCKPWVSNPAAAEMTISFQTVGYCGAFLEYRRIGSEQWIRLPFNCRNGILIRNRKTHILNLTGLHPGTTYQYRVCTLHPMTSQELISPVYEFTTLDAEKNSFSFSVVSDIHSKPETLSKLIENEKTIQSDFLVNLGDFLSCACGTESYLKGIIDTESQWCCRHGKSLVFVRGNHEQIGLFAGIYQDLLPHPSGKTYYSFCHGNVFFLALDAGNDKPDDQAGLFHNAEMLEEERNWLQNISKSDAYRSAGWRIVLIHMPAVNSRYDSFAADSLLRLLPEADLVLAGHLHRYFTIEPGANVCDFKRENRRINIEHKPRQCLVAGNDTDTIIHLDVSESRIELNVRSEDGTFTDHLVINPRT